MTAARDGKSPRAMIHKRILDAAAADPDAPLEEIADDVAGASVDLVDQVLDEYGDPAEASVADAAEPAESESGPAAAEPADVEPTAEPEASDDELSAVQRETLAAVKERPAATQQELGETLGVSAATVCNRLSDIPGFEWADRESFVAERLGAPLIGDGQGAVEQDVAADLAARIDALEQRLAAVDSGPASGVLPPELAHKVIHVCMQSDRFSGDEELAVIQALVGPGVEEPEA